MMLNTRTFNLIISIPILCAIVLAWTTPGWCRADRVFFGMPGPISEEAWATLGGEPAAAHARFPSPLKLHRNSGYSGARRG